MSSEETYWSGLSVSADAGLLRVPEHIARACDAACADYLLALADNAKKVQLLADFRGMGTFPSGIQLAEKFSKKATGGVLSLDEVLRQHADVVKAMREFFRRFFTDIEGQDGDNAALIGQNGQR